VKGRLFDTCIIDDILDGSSPHHGPTVARFIELPKDELALVSVITLGEIEYGIRVAPAGRMEDLAGYRKLVTGRFPYALPVQKPTSEAYGELRGRLFERYAPRDFRSKKRRVEQIQDPESGLSLGIQENDLWLVAQAYEHNLVLVTRDKMRHLVAIASPDVEFELW